MTVQCCVCQKIKTNQRWVKRREPKGPISSTYCPACRIDALKGMARERKEAQLAR